MVTQNLLKNNFIKRWAESLEYFCRSNLIGKNKFKEKRKQEYRNTRIQEYRNTRIQEYKNIGIQEFRNIGIQEYRNEGNRKPER